MSCARLWYCRSDSHSVYGASGQVSLARNPDVVLETERFSMVAYCRQLTVRFGVEYSREQSTACIKE